MVDLVFRNLTTDRAVSERFFRRALEATASVAQTTDPWEVSVTLVGEKRIRDLNRTHRRKDAVTDVLSFPLGEMPVKGYTSSGSGDMFICPSYARSKAEREGIPFKRMMAWLTVHGALHLLGYDHPDASVGTPTLRRRGEQMSALEGRILEKLES